MTDFYCSTMPLEKYDACWDGEGEVEEWWDVYCREVYAAGEYDGGEAVLRSGGNGVWIWRRCMVYPELWCLALYMYLPVDSSSSS